MIDFFLQKGENKQQKKSGFSKIINIIKRILTIIRSATVLMKFIAGLSGFKKFI